MNKVGMPVLRCAVALVGFAFLASSMLLCGGPAHAAMSARNIIPKGSDELSLIQHAQYVYGGYSYCWFPAGWQGPGWYVCNYGPWVRGRWWGGPAGWRGWYYRGGPRPYWRGRGDWHEHGRWH